VNDLVKILEIPERIENIKRFLNKKNENGPIIGFYFGDYFVLKTYKHAQNLLGIEDLKSDDIDIEGLLLDHEDFFEANKDLPGSSIWAAEPIWSIPWIEAILGARIEICNGSYTSSAKMSDVTLESGKKGRLFINKMWESTLLKYIERLVSTSDGRFPVAIPLLRGPSDLLSTLYGYEEVIYKMIDEPDLVKKVLLEIADYYLELVGKIFKILPLYYDGSFIYCRNLWLPGRSFSLQEDAAGSIMSPKIYKEFIFRLDCKIIDCFPNVFYHLHSGTYKILLEMLLNIDKLKVIEIWLDLTGPDVRNLLPDFKKILDSGKSLYIWSEMPMEQVVLLLKNLPYGGRGVFLEIKVSSKEDAIKKMEIIESLS